MSRTITIYVDGSNHFSVHEGEHMVTGPLGYDELLGQIATMCHPRLDGRGQFDLDVDAMLAQRLRWKADRLNRDADELIEAAKEKYR